MNTELNIERLHHVTECLQMGIRLPRQSGKTLSMIYQLIGSVEVAQPNSTFVVIAHNSHWRKQLILQVLDEIEHNSSIGMQLVKQTEFLTVNGIHVMFILPEDVKYRGLCGINVTNYFIDDEEQFYEIYKYDADEIISHLQTRL
jgi:hypothetical protein